MRALFSLLMHALLATLLLASLPVRAQVHDHALAAAQADAAAMQAVTHTACDPHRAPAQPLASHDGTPRCQRACLALSAGFSAVLPVQAQALRLADGASPHPDARHTLPTGRVVMPERRPPRAA